MTRRRFNISAAISLLLFLGTLIVHELSVANTRFIDSPLIMDLWMIDFRGGVMSLNNRPQVNLEMNPIYRTLRHLKYGFRDTETSFHLELDRASYDSPPYRGLLRTFNTVRAMYEISRVRVQAQLILRSHEFSVDLWIVILLAAVLPLIWLTRRIVAHPLLWTQICARRAIVPLGLLALSAAIALLGVRSYWAGPEWFLGQRRIEAPLSKGGQFVTQSPWFVRRWLSCEGGCIAFDGEDDTYPWNPRVESWKYLGSIGSGSIVARTKKEANANGASYWWAPGITVEIRRSSYEPNGRVLGGYQKVIISLWIPLSACVVMPAFWLRSSSRRVLGQRRRACGQCFACGYSMTGNTSGVCPECGTAVGIPHEIPRGVPGVRLDPLAGATAE